MPFQFDYDDILNEMKSFNENLAVGMQHLLTMDESFEGVTPYDVLDQQGKVRLLRYRSDDVVERHPVPLLIVYALVNRPYMTDLQENHSMVSALLENGQEVYLIDWGYPEAIDRYLSLGDYLHGYLNHCVDKVCELHACEQVNLLGICQGGTFALCYSAMYPYKVKNLVTMVTPVDFQTEDNMLSHWVQNVDIDLLVDALGNVPGEMLNWAFLNLKPYRLLGQKYLGLVDLMRDHKVLQDFMHMERWIFDSPDQAGEAFRQFVKELYQQNKLIAGELKIDGQAVRLSQLTMPILNIYARQDHIVPPSASQALQKYVGSQDYVEMGFNGGHIGFYVSAKAQKIVPPAIAAWLDERC